MICEYISYTTANFITRLNAATFDFFYNLLELELDF
jgi:hypothetical protein